MSLRQRPQNAPPPHQDAYSNYRPPIQGQVGAGQASPQFRTAPAPPSQGFSSSTSAGPPPTAPTASTNGPAPSGAGAKPPPLSLEQSRQVARTHYDALKGWLNREGALANASTRTNAREKLTRLTRQQFQELSTDVFDELVRRMEDAAGRPGEQPFLAVRPDFHPKRNQARQKLATLPLQRFRDLASDVYFELDRRYPEFGQDDQFNDANAPHRSDSLSSMQNRNKAPSPTPPPNLNAQRRAPTPNGNNTGPRSPIERNAPTPPFAAPTSNDVVVPNKSTMVVEEPSGNFAAPSQNPSQPSPVSPPAPEAADELSPLQNQQPTFSFGNSSKGASDAKDEQPERPAGHFRGFGAGHQSRASEASSVGTSKFFGGYAGSTGPSEAGGRRSNEMPQAPWERDQDDRAALEKQRAEYEYKLTRLQTRVQELERENEDAASALRGRSGDQERVRDLEGQVRSQQQRYDEQTGQLRLVQRDFDSLQQRHQQQQQSAKSASAGNEDTARLRSDLDAAEDLANELRGEVSSLVDELRQVNERCEELQAELDRERSEKETKEREAREWKDKWQSVKTELRNIKATSMLFTSSINVERDFMPASPDGLINDASIAAFQTSIDDLLQAARSKEPTSVISHARQVVSAVEKIDQDVQAISPSRFNSLPLADQDIVNSLKAKINATLSNLMTASKNHATSFGVSPVSLLDAAASHLASTIVELVRILKIRRTSGTHPTRSASLESASGPSRYHREPMPALPEDPSYLASSPPPAATNPTRDLHNPQVSSPPKANGYVSGGVSSLVSSGTAGMRTALEAMGIASSSASRSSLEKDRESIVEPPQRPLRPEEPMASPQSDYGASPQPLGVEPSRQDSYGSNAYRSSNDDQRPRFDSYDQRGQSQYGGYDGQYDDGAYGGTGDAGQYGSPSLRGGPERNVEELKAYIENQTEAIVHSIQSLLSAIRSGSQGEELNENLTQIITIVSSIVAISKDALPSSASPNGEGESILADLTNHCDKLSEMQSETTGGSGGQAFAKQTKQAMATASFGVAKSLKQLNGLLASVVESEQGLV
ncbi:hypothetical protein JCM10212_003230 [Sporobolomyces blumeae]